MGLTRVLHFCLWDRARASLFANMKRKAVSLLMNHVKRLQIESNLFEFQLLGIEQFIWALDYRTFGALACTSKRARESLPLSHDYNKIPKHRAIRLAREYRKLNDQKISQFDYNIFAKSMFTEQEFIDYALIELVPSDRKIYVSNIINATQSNRKPSLLECFNQYENITSRLDSLKETNFPLNQFTMTNTHRSSYYLEFAFQGGSLFQLGKIYAFESYSHGHRSFSPVFSTWKSLDNIKLDCVKELQKEIQIPLPLFWKTGHEMLIMIYNQPGFAVLSSIVDWRGNFGDFISRCYIDYTEQDFAKLELDVNCFLNLQFDFAREPPLWVWQTLFPHKDISMVPSHLKEIIVSGDIIARYFNLGT